MVGVGAMKAAPVLDAERPQHRMIAQLYAAAKAAFGVGEGGVHGHQCVVKAPQGITVQAIVRDCHVRRFASRWYDAELGDCKSPHAIAYRWFTAERTTSVHHTANALGGAGETQEEMFEDLPRRPLAGQGAMPVGVRPVACQLLHLAANML